MLYHDWEVFFVTAMNITGASAASIFYRWNCCRHRRAEVCGSLAEGRHPCVVHLVGSRHEIGLNFMVELQRLLACRCLQHYEEAAVPPQLCRKHCTVHYTPHDNEQADVPHKEYGKYTPHSAGAVLLTLLLKLDERPRFPSEEDIAPSSSIVGPMRCYVSQTDLFTHFRVGMSCSPLSHKRGFKTPIHWGHQAHHFPTFRRAFS